MLMRAINRSCAADMGYISNLKVKFPSRCLFREKSCLVVGRFRAQQQVSARKWEEISGRG